MLKGKFITGKTGLYHECPKNSKNNQLEWPLHNRTYARGCSSLTRYAISLPIRRIVQTSEWHVLESSVGSRQLMFIRSMVFGKNAAFL
jgi:hypothetical protein